MTRLEEIDARVAYLRDLYAAGEVTDDDLEREVRSLAVERVALVGDDVAVDEEQAEPDDVVGEALPLPRARLGWGDRADQVVDALAAFCEAWQSYRARG